jgi:translocation and assembly module TamB
MGRWSHIALTVFRWLMSAIVFLAVLLFLLLDTAPGLSVLASLITPLSGGEVTVHGLRGNVPNALHVDTLEVRDARGVWLRAENVSLHWSALAAIDNHIAVRQVSASKIVLLRMPEPENTGGTTPQIDIDRLIVPRIEIDAPVVGHAAILMAKGSLHYLSWHQLSANLTVTQLDGNDRYRMTGGIRNDVATGTIAISENGKGILGGLVGMPGLGALHLTLQAGGARAANTIAFDLLAGSLRGSGQGTVALAHRQADVDFQINAPAMRPSADLSWQSLAVEGHFHGRFDAPLVNAKLRLADVAANGIRMASLSADIAGRNGTAELTGEADGVRIPGGDPALFARAPFTLKANADFGAAGRPVTFAVSHPLGSITGSVRTAGPGALAAVVTVPSLTPFAALSGTDVGGSARIDVHARQDDGITTLALNADLKAEGKTLVARMLGPHATLTLRANLAGSDIASSSVTLRGAGITSDLTGSFRGQSLNYTVALTLPDAARLANTLDGNMVLTGYVRGPLDTARAQLSGGGSLASKGFARQRIGLSLQTVGLLNPSSAHIRVNGNFDEAPLSIDGELIASGDADTRRAKLSADWKSLTARADVALAKDGAARGKIVLALKRLSDLASIVGTALQGSLHAGVDFKPEGTGSRALLRAEASAIRAGDVKISSVIADGTIDNIFAVPSLSLAAEIHQLSARDMSGDAKARLNGPLDKLAVKLDASLRDADGNPARATAVALLNTDKQSLVLQQLNGDWRGQHMHLTAPTTIDFANGLAVDHFAAIMAGGNIELSGRFMPALAASFSARAIPASAFEQFSPQFPMQGSLSASTKFTGTLQAPQGNITIEGRGLGARGISSKAIAPADLDVQALLHGDALTLHATLGAGNSAHLTLNGEAPLAAGGALNLRAAGNADLAMLNPIIAADGRQVRGTVSLDGSIAGTIAAPQVTGSARIGNGELQDFARGVRIRNISAALAAHGSRIDITQLSARAGDGTIGGTGSIDLSTAGLPVNIALEMKDARPVVSDRLTATLSGDAKITGKLEGLLNVSANIRVSKGEINLPDQFPSQVAVLDVRRRGQGPPSEPGGTGKIVLDVTLTSPNRFYIRGHGIDAEMGGRVHLTGTTNALLVSGGFDMERGTFSIAGQTLTFTTGKIGFDGSGVRNRLDPTLNLVAQTTSGGVTATLMVGGYASAPKIALSSSPQLPQDEVLAHLLFQQSVKQLTPFQLAEIAQALASLSGIGSGFDALGTVRKGLGLDRLSVGGTSGESAQTTVEAGKYIARNIYVGAKQNLSGGTQLQVEYDITRKLKAQATLSAVTNATVTKGSAAADTGSSIGLGYQFEY